VKYALLPGPAVLGLRHLVQGLASAGAIGWPALAPGDPAHRTHAPLGCLVPLTTSPAHLETVLDPAGNAANTKLRGQLALPAATGRAPKITAAPPS
jgi:hypothetical protein